MLGPNAFQRCSERLVALWRRLRDELGLATHTHLLETKAQGRRGQAVWPGGTVGEMVRCGLLDDRLSVAHGLWVTLEERDLLAAHGVTVVHNPASNLMLGSGRLSLPAKMQAGVPLALGTDSSNSGGPHNLFEVMRLALMLSRPETPDARDWPTSARIFEMATTGGARALGLAGTVGRLERGQRADLVLLSSRTAGLAPVPVTLPHLVQHAGTAAVTAVMINGAWVLRDGRLLAFDEPAVIAQASSVRAECLASARLDVEFAETAAPYFSTLVGCAPRAPSGPR
jgi:5-methylthioadenosine/S-adenosylhomocysteine deaminase